MFTAKVDLHCHSIASSLSGTWILNKIGCSESYTSPESVYELAMKRGMDFVTITDHDSIEGVKNIAHHDNVITGIEATALFPDGVKAHVICLDISEGKYNEIIRLKSNIYDLVDYLSMENILHFLAHPMYKVGGDLTWEHFEKLILLFKRHEVVNGGRYDRTNHIAKKFLSSLTQEYIDYLADKHRIQPIGDKPWEKFFIGGSDDHGGLFIGSCHTEVSVPEMTKESLLKGIRDGHTEAQGSTDGSLTLAHQIISVAYQYFTSIKGKSSEESNMLDLIINQSNEKKKSIYSRWKMRRAIKRKPKENNFNLIDEVKEVVKANPDLARLFQSKELTCEEFNSKTFTLAAELLDRLILDLTRRPLIFSSLLTWGAGILSTYLISMSATRRNSDLLCEAESMMGMERPKKVAWFTDRYHGTDGVVTTINKFLKASSEYNCNITIAISDDGKHEHPENVKSFPSIAKFEIPMYNQIDLYVPSLLKVARWVEEEEFDSVVISTPGPMGFAGMIAAKVFGLPITTIYHTDLPKYASKLTGDFRLTNLVTSLTKAFYDQSERILVPSGDYATELMQWGINAEKIGFLRRWVDTNLFSPDKRSQNGFFGHRKGIKLLYVGRISKEKNMDLLIQAHSELSRLSRDFNIYCIGDGPYLNELKEKTTNLENFLLLGPMYGEELATAYATGDAFIFPSLTDTFGNVVLEAQASGLPCVVMHKGGPKEIVVNNRTGFVSNNESEFIEAIDRLILDVKLRKSMSQEAVFNAQRFDKAEIFSKFWQDVTGQTLPGDWESGYGSEVPSLSYV